MPCCVVMDMDRKYRGVVQILCCHGLINVQAYRDSSERWMLCVVLFLIQSVIRRYVYGGLLLLRGDPCDECNDSNSKFLCRWINASQINNKYRVLEDIGACDLRGKYNLMDWFQIGFINYLVRVAPNTKKYTFVCIC